LLLVNANRRRYEWVLDCLAAEWFDMPTLTELKKRLEQALDDPDLKAETYARPLRQAGLLTTGGRGTSTPQVTVPDCARLLMAILSPFHARRAVEAVRTYEALELRRAAPGPRGRRSARADRLPAEELASLPLDRIGEVRLFGQLVEFLLLRAVDGSLERAIPRSARNSGEPQLALQLIGPRYRATLRLSEYWSPGGVTIGERQALAYGRPDQALPNFPRGLTRAGEVHEDTLIALARLFSPSLSGTAD
jgi:hypothetical protein